MDGEERGCTELRSRHGLRSFSRWCAGGVSILSIGSVVVYACIPAVVGLTVAVVLFIRERPIEIESLSGRVVADPRKLYGRYGGSEMTTIKRNPDPDAPTRRQN